MAKKNFIWLYVIIAVVIVSLVTVLIINIPKMRSISIIECECGGMNSIKCPSTFSCIIPEGSSTRCGTCERLGTGSAAAAASGGKAGP